MSVTPGSTKFKVWRENVDETLETKAEHSKSVTTTLLASGWAGIDAPYIYELEVEGLGAEQNGKIGVAQWRVRHSCAWSGKRMENCMSRQTAKCPILTFR